MPMTIAQEPAGDPGLQTLKRPETCSVCGKRFHVRVPRAMLDSAPAYPFCHVILHGDPIHAHMVYVDKHGTIRGGQSSTSIQIDRTSATFQQLVTWWSLPDGE